MDRIRLGTEDGTKENVERIAQLFPEVVTEAADAALWKEIYASEFEDNETLAAILEDSSIYWADELPYVLNTCISSFEEMARTGRWSFPPLYQSDVLAARGKTDVDSDRDFVRALVTAIEKAFQSGGDQLRAQGLRIESLAKVASMDDEGHISFC